MAGHVECTGGLTQGLKNKVLFSWVKIYLQKLVSCLPAAVFLCSKLAVKAVM